MSTMSGIYDSGPIQPVARIKENLSIWTNGKYAHYVIEYQEPIPPSPASTIEMVVASGNTSLAANTSIGKRVVGILQLNEMEFLHVRFEPLDNVEGVIWEVSGQAKFNTRAIHARVDKRTRQWDPYLATTTFFILGVNRDMNLEVRNPMGYATPTARFMFWGNRSLLKDFPLDGVTEADKLKLREGDRETVRRIIGTTTWLPAEGKSG